MPPDLSASVMSLPKKPRSRGPFAIFMNKYGTPLTTVFFLISTITGVALFFHWGPGAFHPMHEWLSMVLLLAFALHVIKNWVPLLNYGRRGLLYIPLVVGVVASAYFFIQPSGKQAGNKLVAFRLAAMAGKAPIIQLSPLFQTDEEGVLKRLRAQHFTVASATETVEQVAKESGRSANDVLLALMPGTNTYGHEHKKNG